MMKEKINVNDGNGLFDNIGLIDTLIVDCNTIVKHLVSGNEVAFCAKIVEMVQKLNSLRKGVTSDTESLQKEISDLRRFIDDINNVGGGNGVQC